MIRLSSSRAAPCWPSSSSSLASSTASQCRASRSSLISLAYSAPVLVSNFAFPTVSSRSAPPVLRSAWSAFGLAVIAMAAAAFYLPALEATGGTWPAPLDDTYIYYGFARSTALGHPLAYTPDGGYASGATSAIYPLLLAPLWALGLRGPH